MRQVQPAAVQRDEAAHEPDRRDPERAPAADTDSQPEDGDERQRPDVRRDPRDLVREVVRARAEAPAEVLLGAPAVYAEPVVAPANRQAVDDGRGGRHAGAGRDDRRAARAHAPWSGGCGRHDHRDEQAVEPRLLHEDRDRPEEARNREPVIPTHHPPAHCARDDSRRAHGRRELALHREPLEAGRNAGDGEYRRGGDPRRPRAQHPADRADEQRQQGPGEHRTQPDGPRVVADVGESAVEHDQPLRAIDEEVPVEVGAARPLVRDERVAALVGTDTSPHERDAQGRGEEGDRGERDPDSPRSATPRRPRLPRHTPWARRDRHQLPRARRRNTVISIRPSDVRTGTRATTPGGTGSPAAPVSM